MTTCPGCGRELQPGVQFCGGCGWAVQAPTLPTWGVRSPSDPPTQPPAQYVPPEYQPPPPAPSRGRDPRLLMVVIGCVAALAVAAGAAVFAIEHVSYATGHGVAAPGASSPAPVQPAAPSVTVVEPTPTVETTEPTPTPTPTDEASAEAALAQQVSADHGQVEQLVGLWVPQVSSKKLGLVVNGVTYDYQQIWADYQQLAAQYPGALLLRSSDYTSFTYSDFWVTVVPQTFDTPDGANAWCDSQNIDANDCFAKKLMHTGGVAGTTVFRN